jgi:hypothetical protein
MAAISKRVSETIPIALYWRGYLAEGETISTVDVTVPTGLSKEGVGVIAGLKTTQTVYGGTAGMSYDVVFKITTSAGLIYEDIYTVHVN